MWNGSAHAEGPGIVPATPGRVDPMRRSHDGVPRSQTGARRALVTAAATCLVLALVAAACGSTSKNAATGGGPTSTTTRSR